MSGLVDLTVDVKPHLNIPPEDTSQDAELVGFVEAATPIIEDITGPVLPRTITEMHDGGGVTIMLRNAPVLSITSIVEFSGPITFTLAVVADAAHGTTYSVTWDNDGLIVRRTVGTTSVFPNGPDAVLVTYVAGCSQVPPNARLAALELIRHNYQQTQLGGRPAFGGGDAMEDTFTPSGYAVPHRVVELLGPNRRTPSVA